MITFGTVMTLAMKIRAILACLLWGSAFAGAKIGFTYAEPILLSGMRFMLAGILLVPVILAQKADLAGTVRKHWKFMLVFAFLQTFMQYGLFFMGLDKVPGSTSAIIIGAGPLFVAIMAHLTMRDDKMSLRKILAIILGLSGVVFISLAKGSELAAGGSSFWVGVGLLVLSNLMGSYTNIMVAKKKDAHISPVVLTAFANFTGGVMLLLTSLVVEKPQIGPYPPEFYLALIWLAIIPAGAFSLWYGVLQKPGVKVSELNMWKFIVPVSGCILSWMLLLGEQPDAASVIGIIVIIGALQLVQLPEHYFQRKRMKP